MTGAAVDFIPQKNIHDAVHAGIIVNNLILNDRLNLGQDTHRLLPRKHGIIQARRFQPLQYLLSHRMGDQFFRQLHSCPTFLF